MSGLLQARDLRYAVAGRTILDGVSLDLRPGETLGVIGASGAGKTTLARLLTGLLRPDSGSVRASGPVQMIFQDPYDSLDPRRTILRIVAEPLIALGVPKAEREARAREALDAVSFPPDAAHRLPAAFSGGQRQRAAIARALIGRPAVIVADEPVSALDVMVQARILNLMLDLQRRFALSFVFISHDMAVIRHMSHRVAVLENGRIAPC